MLMLAQITTALILLLHVYIVLLETVLFNARGRKVFAIKAENAAQLKPALSNQGCYNLFLVAALAIGLLHPNAAIAHAFTYYGLACVAVAGVWGGITIGRRILFIQTAPALVALALYLMA